MGPLKTGLIQIYTGDGKGKTSAAFGLALRAIGRGLKVFIIQFIKGGFDYGELHSVKQLPNLTLRAFGRGKFIIETPPSEEDIKHAQEAFNLARTTVQEGEQDVIILDEINVALSLGLIKTVEVIKLVQKKPKHVEVVLTGRNAPSELIEIADLVTEMREVKHPFHKGVQPRKGIEH